LSTAFCLESESFLSTSALPILSQGAKGVGIFSISNSEAYFSIKLVNRSAKPLHSSIIGIFPFFSMRLFVKFQYFCRYLLQNRHSTVIVAPQLEVFDLL